MRRRRRKTSQEEKEKRDRSQEFPLAAAAAEIRKKTGICIMFKEDERKKNDARKSIILRLEQSRCQFFARFALLCLF
jgi:hypothetical protein